MNKDLSSILGIALCIITLFHLSQKEENMSLENEDETFSIVFDDFDEYEEHGELAPHSLNNQENEKNAADTRGKLSSVQQIYIQNIKKEFERKKPLPFWHFPRVQTESMMNDYAFEFRDSPNVEEYQRKPVLMYT